MIFLYGYVISLMNHLPLDVLSSITDLDYMNVLKDKCEAEMVGYAIKLKF